MNKKILYTALLLLILLPRASSFGRRRVQKCHRETEAITRKPVIYDPLTDSNETMINHHCDCGLVGFGVIQKIPYLQTCHGCGVIKIDFSTACVRCGMCVAIANKINETLLGVHEIMATDCWLEEKELALLLRTVCDYSFKEYSLREADGKRFISDRVTGSSHVATSVDGSWGRSLKELCHEYLNEIGEQQLYKHWQQWCKDYKNNPDLVTILCRNELSTLRDCRHIETVEKYETPSQMYYAKIEVNMEYDDRK